MGLKSLIAIIFFSTQLVAAEPIDLLLDRGATYEQRQKAKEELGTKSLSAFESSAELCYGIDLCAQETEEDKFQSYCKNTIEQMKEHPMEQMPGECLGLAFRKRYQCSKDVVKLSAPALNLNINLLLDVSQIYSGRITDLLENYFLNLYPELKPFADDESALTQYLDEHQELRAKIESFRSESLGLAQYTMNCYEKINPLLYKKNHPQLTRHFNLIRSTIDMMMMLPTYKGKVNRGTRLPVDALNEHLKIGNIVCNKGFTSTAVHHPSDYSDKPRNYFLNNGDSETHRLYINYEENGALPGRLIDKYSASPGENEVLFEPGACFRIDEVKPRKKDAKAEGTSQVYDIEMTLVPSVQK